MKKIWEIIKKEPARFFAALGVFWSGLITGIVQFDLWHPTVEQLSYANGFVGLVASFLLATFLRDAVTPNVTVEEEFTPNEEVAGKVHETIVELAKIEPTPEQWVEEQLEGWPDYLKQSPPYQ